MGARRLALFVFALGVLDWVFGERHLSILFEEAMSFYLWLARATTAAVVMWICYVALEPYVRRLWPRAMVTWNRLLRGQLRDPLVGRDMQIGLLFGIGLVLMLQVDSLLHEALKKARAEATVAVAASSGFAFTAEEVLSSADDVSTELSNEQLEAIAGGLLEMPFALDDDSPEE